MYRILDGIYTVEGLRTGRVYVIEGNDGLTLIDTSLPKSLPQIEQELQKIGHKLNEIKHILITHAHIDHVGSLAALKQATGAKIYAHHRHDSAVIRGEKTVVVPPRSEVRGLAKLPTLLFKPQNADSAQVDCELKEGDCLDEVLTGLVVVDTPGHTPGHCGFWQPEQRIFFGGDVMVNIPFSLNLPIAAFTPDMAEAKRSIRKVAEMNVATLCLGHGKPLIGNAASIVHAFADKVQPLNS